MESNRKSSRIWCFLCDERAAEVTELSLVLALMVAGSIALISTIGSTVAGYFTDVTTVLP